MRIPIHPRVLFAACVPLILLFIGMIGYRVIEGDEWSWSDALYMAAITLTTVGYGETHPLSPAGRVFTIVFLFAGVFTLFYTATEMIRAVVSGQVRAALGRVRMERALAKLKGHVVVCGLGRMGRLICHEFDRQGVEFVVIDRDAGLLAEATFKHGIPLHGDATSDAILDHAAVSRAKALVAVLPSDADNLYITLSARVLNAGMTIIARAENAPAEAKLRRVGADLVVAPYVIGGRRVAQAVLQPHVHDLLENVVRNEAHDYTIEEMEIETGCRLCGQTIAGSRLHEELGIIILSVKRAGGAGRTLNPRPGTELKSGDVLVVVGHRDQVQEMKSRVGAAAD